MKTAALAFGDYTLLLGVSAPSPGEEASSTRCRGTWATVAVEGLRCSVAGLAWGPLPQQNGMRVLLPKGVLEKR